MNELQLYLQSLKTEFEYDKSQFEINISKIESATTFYHQHSRQAFSDTHLYAFFRTIFLTQTILPDDNSTLRI